MFGSRTPARRTNTPEVECPTDTLSFGASPPNNVSPLPSIIFGGNSRLLFPLSRSPVIPPKQCVGHMLFPATYSSGFPLRFLHWFNAKTFEKNIYIYISILVLSLSSEFGKICEYLKLFFKMFFPYLKEKRQIP